MTRSPDFGNLLAVLRREEPSRPTLFEFHLNYPLMDGCVPGVDRSSPEWRHEMQIKAFARLGYDFATIQASDFHFAKGERAHGRSISQNEGAVITDRASFEAYAWPDPEACDCGRLAAGGAWGRHLAPGQKFMVCGPCGVLENVTELVGFEHLCLLLADDPELVEDIVNAVGSRLLRYYELALVHDTVGLAMVNDDWGFRSSTMLSAKVMRRLIFPWHERIVAVAHRAGRPAVLHSCGNLAQVMDDVIDGLHFDGKHSYEDAILPVEEAYERWGRRIAILGGLDVDFVCRARPEAIRARADAMLARARGRGGYALGTGNSVPDYMPETNYRAMIAAVEAPNVAPTSVGTAGGLQSAVH